MAAESLFQPGTVPSSAESADDGWVNLGLVFDSRAAGTVAAIWVYVPWDPGFSEVEVALYGFTGFDTGDKLEGGNNGDLVSGAWNRVALASPVEIAADTPYIACWRRTSLDAGNDYAYTSGFFSVERTNGGNLRALASSDSTYFPNIGNGRYRYDGGWSFPFDTYGAGWYGIDVEFEAAGGAGGTAPGSILTAAASLVAGTAAGGAAAAGATLPAIASLVSGPAAGGAGVPGTALGATATLAPGSAAAGAAVPGQILGATGLLVRGAGKGGAGVAGRTLTAVAALVPGAASGSDAATGPGAIVTAPATLVPGAATGGAVAAGRVLAAIVSLVAGRAGGADASTRERVLQALFARLAAGRPPGSVLLRNAVLPERIPAAGLMILRDGDPGEPELLIPQHYYEHRAELEVLVDGSTPAVRSQVFAAAVRAVGQALAADRTLGGLVDYASAEAPVPLDLAIEGAAGLRVAAIGIVLPYETRDPLA